MFSIRLRNLLEKIVDEFKDELNDGWYKSHKDEIINEHILLRLDITGEDNKHIPKPVPYNEYAISFQDRSKEDNNELTGEEIVYGDLLVYECYGHDDIELINQYYNLNDVKKLILNFYDNPFINEIFVFENGNIKRWKVEELNDSAKFEWLD